MYETPEYKTALHIIKTYLTPINDVAERNVQLAAQFNEFATKNEKEKQQIFQNVALFRRMPNVNKITLKNAFM